MFVCRFCAHDLWSLRVPTEADDITSAPLAPPPVQSQMHSYYGAVHCRTVSLTSTRGSSSANNLRPRKIVAFCQTARDGGGDNKRTNIARIDIVCSPCTALQSDVAELINHSAMHTYTHTQAMPHDVNIKYAHTSKCIRRAILADRATPRGSWRV